MHTKHLMNRAKVAILAVLTLIVSLLAFPSIAQASVQTAWATPASAVNVQVGPNNMPAAMDCYVDGKLHSYNFSGDEEFVIEGDVNSAVDIGCGNNLSWHPFRITDSVSASGNRAVSVDTDSSYVADSIRLYDDAGVILWDYAVFDECNSPAQIGASPVISNGLVVFTYLSCLSWNSYNIMALDEDDSSVEYDTSIGSVPNTTSLAWFEDGVSFMTNDGWRYILDTGVEDTNRYIEVGVGNHIAQHVDGSVIYKSYDEIEIDTCYLNFHTYGETDVSKEIDCSTQFNDAKTMPNGDLVTLTSLGSDTESVIATVFHKDSNSPNTVIEIEKPAGATSNSFGAYRLHVDANGKIVVPYWYGEEVGDAPFEITYARTAIGVYTPSGIKEFGWSSDIYGSRDVGYWSDHSVALVDGAVYFTDNFSSRLIRVVIPSMRLSYADSVHWNLTSSSYEKSSFIALGDSYSSGEGSFSYDLDDSKCHRSSDAYAFYVADELELNQPMMIACSGAITDDVIPSTNNSLGQIDYIGSDTDIITITIGGNDAGFESVLVACVDHLSNEGYFCSSNQSVTESLSDRMEALAGLRDPQLAPLTAPGTDRVIHPISDVLLQLATNAPNAEIYIAGYPKIFGENSAYYQYDSLAPGDNYCVVNSAPVPNGEAKIGLDDAVWLNDQAELLNTIISNAVDDVVLLGKNVHYVSPSTFDTHGICDSGSPWMNDVDLTGGFVALPESFHPNTTGMILGYGYAFVDKMD